MIRFLLSRIVQGLVVIFAVITITFTLSKLVPGGAVRVKRAQCHRGGAESAGGVLRPRTSRGIVQLGLQLKHYATLDLPDSYHFQRRGVDEIIASGFPVSAAVGWRLAHRAGHRRAAWSARRLAAEHAGRSRQHFRGDARHLHAQHGARAAYRDAVWPEAAMVQCSGWFDSSDWVLPALTLGIIYSAYIARLTRGSLRETLAQEFIRTARAKGSSETSVVFLHAMKLACLPVLNYLGPAAAGLLTGSFIVETDLSTARSRPVLHRLGDQWRSSAHDRHLHLLRHAHRRLQSARGHPPGWLNPRIRLQA
jgi:oligopeptide transport system permease protein